MCVHGYNSYKGHSKRVQLAVTGLGKQKLILGYSWLWKHNPEINWDTWEVKMSQCPSGCMTCASEARTKRKHAKTITCIVWRLQTALVLTICTINMDDRLSEDDHDEFEEDLPKLLLDDSDEPLKDGDRVFHTQFSPWKTSGPPALSRSGWLKPSPRTLHPIRMNFLSGCATLTMSSTERLLIHYQNTGHGTMPSNLSQM
jgi:hypothetical protein